MRGTPHNEEWLHIPTIFQPVEVNMLTKQNRGSRVCFLLPNLCELCSIPRVLGPCVSPPKSLMRSTPLIQSQFHKFKFKMQTMRPNTNNAKHFPQPEMANRSKSTCSRNKAAGVLCFLLLNSYGRCPGSRVPEQCVPLSKSLMRSTSPTQSHKNQIPIHTNASKYKRCKAHPTTRNDCPYQLHAYETKSEYCIYYFPLRMNVELVLTSQSGAPRRPSLWCEPHPLRRHNSTHKFQIRVYTLAHIHKRCKAPRTTRMATNVPIISRHRRKSTCSRNKTSRVLCFLLPNSYETHLSSSRPRAVRPAAQVSYAKHTPKNVTIPQLPKTIHANAYKYSANHTSRNLPLHLFLKPSEEVNVLTKQSPYKCRVAPKNARNDQ